MSPASGAGNPAVSTTGRSGDRVVVVAGEALVDLVATDDGGPYVPHCGGGPYNTARSLARLGVATAFLGRVSSDRFGTMLRAGLQDDGVLLDGAVLTDDPTTLAVAVVDEGGGARYAFYLGGTSAPGLAPADVTLPVAVGALHVGTLGLVLEPVGGTLADLALSLAARVPLVLDPNVRPSAVRHPDRYRERIRRLGAAAAVVKLSDEDARWLHPDLEPIDAARRIVADGAGLVVLTQGGSGSVGVSARGEVRVAAEPVTMVDTIGAGDSFGAGLVCWLTEHGALDAVAALEVADVADALRFASRVAAVTVSRPGADPPRRHEVGGR
jgi:fructokinase